MTVPGRSAIGSSRRGCRPQSPPRRFKKTLPTVVRSQQRFDLLPQRPVIAARLVQVGLSRLGRVDATSRLKDLFFGKRNRSHGFTSLAPAARPGGASLMDNAMALEKIPNESWKILSRRLGIHDFVASRLNSSLSQLLA